MNIRSERRSESFKNIIRRSESFKNKFGLLSLLSFSRFWLKLAWILCEELNFSVWCNLLSVLIHPNEVSEELSVVFACLLLYSHSRSDPGRRPWFPLDSSASQFRKDREPCSGREWTRSWRKNPKFCRKMRNGKVLKGSRIPLYAKYSN